MQELVVKTENLLMVTTGQQHVVYIPFRMHVYTFSSFYLQHANLSKLVYNFIKIYILTIT